MNYSIVTGASGGIGKEICYQLAKKDKNLIILGRNEQKLNGLKEDLLKINPNISVLYYAFDISSTNDREIFYNGIIKNQIKINGLYYSAGIDTQKEFKKYTEEKLVKQSRVNFEGAISFTLFSLNNYEEELKILIVSSLCGVSPMPYFSEYSATKSALITFFTSLKGEIKDKNVKITVLAPSSVPTREDIIKDIELQGLQGKLAKKPANIVVSKGLKALEKNKTLITVGAYNKFVYFMNKITPTKIKTHFIAKKFKNKEKDAF